MAIIRRFLRFYSFVVLLAFAVVSCAVADEPDSAPGPVGSTAQSATTSSQTIRIFAPPSMSPREMAISVTNSLRVNDRSSVVDAANHAAQIANSGTATTNLGTDTRVGNVWSRAAIDLRSRAVVDGFARSESAIRHQDATSKVLGGSFPNTPLGEFNETSWTVQFVSDPTRNVTIERDANQTLAPGAYGNITVRGGGRARLSGGTYFIQSLQLESDSIFDTSGVGASVVVYALNQVTFRANQLSADTPNLILVSLSSNTVFVSTSFRGTIIAPNAKIDLGAERTYVGSFFARELELHQNSRLTASPPAWEQIIPPVVVTRVDAPVIVTGRKDHDTGKETNGSKQTLQPITFRIPERLPVVKGNAANGTAIFTYGTGGSPVSCTYRGRSSRPDPRSDLDRALGRSYQFVSCSNQLTAGAQVSANNFGVRVVSGATNHPLETTVVQTYLGPGCSENLESLIPPDEAVRLRQSFSWPATQALPVKDAQGLPSMRYAWIYVEDQRQIDALQRMRVYFKNRPIFGPDLLKYKGRCGVMENAGDGWGMFVYAIIPSTLYNYLRQVAVTVISQRRGSVPFRAIILPPVPEPGIAHADGSLRWDKIKESGFNYLEQAGPGGQQALFGIKVPIVDDVVDTVVNTVDKAISGAPGIGGAIGGFFQFGDSIGSTAIGILPTTMSWACLQA